MNKKIKTLIAASVLTVAMGTTALADKSPVDDLNQAMIEMGVSKSDRDRVVSYLQTIKITDAQANQVLSKVEEAKQLIGNVNDISKLSSQDKSKLYSIAVEAAKPLGLTVQVSGLNTSDLTSVVITTSTGGTLVQLNTKDIMGLVKDFNINVITNVIQEAVEFSNDENKYDLDGDGKPDTGYIPGGGGELNNTATPYGNLMLAGTTMIGMAGGIHVVSKKKK